MVGYMPQFPRLVDGDTLRSQVAPWLTTSPTRRSIASRGRMGLDALADWLPLGWDTPVTSDMFSGGQRRRIALGRMLLSDRPVLVFDEALVGIDPEGRDQLLSAIGRLTQGKTVLWITHSLPPRWADRVIVLRHGDVIEDGAPQALANRRGGVLALRVRRGGAAAGRVARAPDRSPCGATSVA